MSVRRLLAQTFVLAAAACGGPAQLHYPTQVAHGRPAGCPDDAIDPYGDGTPSSMATRCTYDDAAGVGLTRLGGSVLAHEGPGSPGVGLADLFITVHVFKGGAPGKQVGHARTDAQGRFHLSASLRPADYVIVVRGAPNGEVLAQKHLALEGKRARTMEDLVIWVAEDPALKRTTE